MDNHPIPQDVTGFKFKLIGSITVRQFSYLLFAAIICYIFFALPIFFLIKIPFIGIFAALGFMLAFVPIDGRPMDLMFVNFMRAIPRDNQWIYQKRGVDLSFLEYHPSPLHGQNTQRQKPHSDDSDKRRKLAALLQSRNNPTSDMDPHDVDFLDKMKGFFSEQTLVQQTAPLPQEPTEIVQDATPVPPPAPMPIADPTVQQSVNTILMSTVGAASPQPSQQIQQEKKSVEEKPDTPEEPTLAVPQLSVPPSEPVVENKEPVIPAGMTQQESSPHHQEVKQIAKEINHQRATEGSPAQDTSRVRTLVGDAAVAAGFPTLPDIPNILIGVVKDPRGKILSNVLVEVFDKNDIPVRAFKTNALGQFASATPLPDGKYSIRLEDPLASQEFDTIEITLTGEIFQPLEVISIDGREKLRLELFG